MNKFMYLKDCFQSKVFESKIIVGGLLFILISFVSVLLIKGDLEGIRVLQLNDDIIDNIDTNTHSQGGVISATATSIYAIDRLDINDNIVNIEGYGVKRGVPSRNYMSSLVAYDSNNNIWYKLPTQLKIRSDVTAYINDGVYYDLSGFASQFRSDILHGTNLFYLYSVNDENWLIDLEVSIP